MDELLQLDLSGRPSETGHKAFTQPRPPAPTPAQPSLLDDVSSHSTGAWSSPFAAWDSLVSPSDPVRSPANHPAAAEVRPACAPVHALAVHV